MRNIAPICLALVFAVPATAQVRIKDITTYEGARSNQLYGFGLVVGLDGTGSRSTFTQQVAADMLQRLRVTAKIFSQLPSDAVLRSTSASAVMVTAEIGPFDRQGGRLDVTVSALDDARSLQGGVLLFTPLQGADGDVYAVAQGPLSIGGFGAAGIAASVQKNQLNVGRIPGGATVEREALGCVLRPAGPGTTTSVARLLLRDADLNTARLIARAINQRYPGVATPHDAGAVTVCVPPTRCHDANAFLSELELLEVRPDVTARVVINERTGTLVAGHNVKLSAVAVAHGSLIIRVAESPIASQPNPFAGGETVVLPRTDLSVTEEDARFNVLPQSTTVAEVAQALNALGVTPRDLIAIFQALKQAGALHAELIVI